jgi:hypothetical protein
MLTAQTMNTAVPVDTFRSGDTAAALERLQDSPLVCDGKVNMLSLGVIRDHLGSRWPSRAEQVHDHVARTLARHLGHSGYYFQISDTDFVVVELRGDRYAAQASCFTYMRDLLRHFFGKDAPADIEIREVTRIGGGQIDAKTVVANLATLPCGQETGAGPAAAAEAPSYAGPADRWSALENLPEMGAPVSEARRAGIGDGTTPFVSQTGRRLQISMHLSPAFRLNGSVEIGACIRRRIVDLETREPLGELDRARLSPRDLERIDAATIAGAIARCRSTEKPLPMVMAPVFYSTLASRRTRTDMIARLQQAKAQINTQLVCEITDLDGAPLNALYNSCSILRRFCYAVFGRVSDVNPRSVGALRGAGFNGLTVRYQGPRDPASLFAELKLLVDLCRPVSQKVLTTDLERPEEMIIAHLAGATHAALRDSPIDGPMSARD